MDWENVWSKLDERLIVKCTEKDVFKYVGLNIKQSNNYISIDQQHMEILDFISNKQFEDSVTEAGDYLILNDIGQSYF